MPGEAQAVDAQDDELDPDLTVIAPLIAPRTAPRTYAHVTKALYEKPWAVQRQMLTFMVGLVRARASGTVLSSDEIAERLEAARSQNGDRSYDKPFQMVGSTAVIPMYGLLSQRMSLMSLMSGGTSLDEMRATLREALDDSEVRSIVFDIDSPGGSVDGVTEFATELRAARAGDKPIIAQVNTLAASAAYWLATQMTEVVVTPSGEVGSIGVFAVHEDYSKADEMMGVKTTLVSAGKYKVEGNEFEPLSDEARDHIQDQVDTFYQSFVSDVAKGRGTNTTAVDSGYGEGRTMLARKALSAGMVDRIDTLEATVARLQRGGTAARRAAIEAQTELLADVIPIDSVAVAAAHGARVERNARLRAKQPATFTRRNKK